MGSALGEFRYRKEARKNLNATKPAVSKSIVIPHVEHAETKEDEHRSHELSQWQWERRAERERKYLAWLTFGASIAAAIGAGYAAVVAQGQLEAARDEQRAWVKVGVSPGDFRWIDVHDLDTGTVHDMDGSMSPQISITNVGKSPAFDVRIGVWTKIATSSGVEGRIIEVHDALINYCGQHVGIDYPASVEFETGKTLFPEEKGYANSDETETSSTSVARPKFPAGNSKLEPFDFYMIGCADYRIIQDARRHQTYFTYMVGTQDLGGFVVGKNVAASTVRLSRQSYGNDAN